MTRTILIHKILITERGDLYCGDTGDSDREEINLIKPGKNYGWNLYEGSVAENVQSTSIGNSFAKRWILNTNV